MSKYPAIHGNAINLKEEQGLCCIISSTSVHYLHSCNMLPGCLCFISQAVSPDRMLISQKTADDVFLAIRLQDHVTPLKKTERTKAASGYKMFII